MKRIVLLVSVFAALLISCDDHKSGLSEEDIQVYTKIGDNVVKTTAKTLIGQVKGHLKKGGVAEAIPYCNKNASNILRAISKDYHVVIKRTTNRLRNPGNHPGSRESEILNSFLKLNEQAKPIHPVVEKGDDDKIHYYAPIKIMDKCLICHGVVGKQVTSETDSIIKSYYPDDQATGYKTGDLRGIWSITFMK